MRERGGERDEGKRVGLGGRKNEKGKGREVIKKRVGSQGGYKEEGRVLGRL